MSFMRRKYTNFGWALANNSINTFSSENIFCIYLFIFFYVFFVQKTNRVAKNYIFEVDSKADKCARMCFERELFVFVCFSNCVYRVPVDFKLGNFPT